MCSTRSASRSRDFACPVTAISPEATRPDGTSVHDLTSSDPIVFDDDLNDLAPATVSVTLILIKRVNGVPRYGAPSPALSYTFVDGGATVSMTPDATMGFKNSAMVVWVERRFAGPS